MLLLADLPKQGCILCSTAIEKCAKAVLAIDGNASRGHLKTAHWNVLRKQPQFGHLLNPDFVELNKRAYHLRYSDNLSVEFNMVIASREFLAEMDHTVLTVLSCFSIDEGKRHRPTAYESALQRGDQRLVAENHLISKQRVEEFVYALPQYVYEVRSHPQRGLLEAYYTTTAHPREPGFLRAGLRTISRDDGFEGIENAFFPLSDLSLLRDGSEQRGAAEGRRL